MVLPSSTSDNTSNIKLIDFGVNKQLQRQDVKSKIVGHFKTYYTYFFDRKGIDDSDRGIFSSLLIFLNISTNVLYVTHEPIVSAFNKLYDDIIMNLSTHIQTLLQKETPIVDKRKIVFKILMFLAFIDGLILKQEFSEDRIQCQTIMKYMFTRDIFGNLSTFLKYSSLDYHKYLEKTVFNTEDKTRLPIISGIALVKAGVTVEARYTMLCNIILDKICQDVAQLLSEPPASGGGKNISKKIYSRPRKSTKRTTRRRLRRKSTKRIRRRRTTRATRK